jgi:hypothetical protein
MKDCFNRLNVIIKDFHLNNYYMLLFYNEIEHLLLKNRNKKIFFDDFE